jgi:hypothetical protein
LSIGRSRHKTGITQTEERPPPDPESRHPPFRWIEAAR